MNILSWNTLYRRIVFIEPLWSSSTISENIVFPYISITVSSFCIIWHKPTKKFDGCISSMYLAYSASGVCFISIKIQNHNWIDTQKLRKFRKRQNVWGFFNIIENKISTLQIKGSKKRSCYSATITLGVNSVSRYEILSVVFEKLGVFVWLLFL